MSTIEVDKVIPQSGTSVQIGENGDTITVPAGATFDASSGTLTLPDGSVSVAKLSATGTKDTTTFLRGDNSFQVVNTDLVSDTSPQLGGNLDGNGNTIDLSANNTELRLPRGTTAQQPTPSADNEGAIRYDTDDNLVYYSDGTNWLKISAARPTLSSVTGNIRVGSATTLTLAGTNFLTANLVVNFTQVSDSINENVTVTPSSETAASVAVPAAVYNNVTAGNAVTIKVTNSDGLESGNQSVTATAVPTGGTISNSGSYRVHTFLSSGTFTVPTGLTLNNLEYLVVAGGGAGAIQHSGGGGAGGFRTNVSGATSGGGGSAESAINVGAGSYTVTVGGGGAKNTNLGNTNGTRGNSGDDSTIGFTPAITSIGGGRAGRYNSLSASSGGSGGGGATDSGTGAAGTANQGYAGGDASGANHGAANSGGGGGGGAGGVGSNGNPGDGGIGVQSSIDGTTYYYAGGGGGSRVVSNGGNGSRSGNGGAGGGGGGGDGSSPSGAVGGTGGSGRNAGGNGGASNGTNSNATGGDGGDNTGGGGGGSGRWEATAGKGGSGIVIIRYIL